MDALIGADLDEWRDAGRQFVARAQDAAVLVEIAVVIAADRAVSELRLLINSAVDRPLEADIEPIEFLPETGSGAEARVDRQLGKVRRQIRAVRVVGRNL